MKSHFNCRCCLFEACYKDMRNEYYFEGQKEVYYEMLVNTFQIKVKDHFMICEDCVLQLRSASAFKQQVLQAGRAILGLLSEGLPNATLSNFNEPDDFLDHITGNYEDESDESSAGDQWKGDGSGKNDDLKLFFVKTEDNTHFTHPPLSPKHPDEEENPKNNGKDTEHTTTDDALCLNEVADASNSSEDLFLADYNNDDRNVKLNTKEIKAKKKTELKLSQIKAKKSTEPKLKDKLKPTQSKKQSDVKENSLKLINNSNLLLFDSLKIKFRCFYCKESFLKITELRQHNSKHDEEKKKLSICVRRLRGLSYKCVDISSLCCKLCASNLENLTDLQTHLTDQHGIEFSNKEHLLIPYKLENSFQCVLCQEDFNTFYRLLVHMNSHYTNNVCEMCGLSYINRQSLRCHVQAVHKEKKCSKCPATFLNNYARVKHMRKVHNSRSSVRYCLQCNKTFQYAYMLAEHRIQEHGAERKVSVCGECGKTFLTAQNLRIHTRSVHRRERQHACSACGMAFFTSCDKRRHMATHQEGRSFSCNFCEGRFKSKDSLRRHLRRQHGHAFDRNLVLEADT